MNNVWPLDPKKVEPILSNRIGNFDEASIRQIVLLVDELQKETGTQFLRMEFGSPGLPPPKLALDEEIRILQTPELISTYTPINGLPKLKSVAKKFIKTFLNIEIAEEHIVPTVGSMQAGLLAQSLAMHTKPKPQKILFVDPCFSVHRVQAKFLNVNEVSVDLYDRKNWLRKVEEHFKSGEIGGILYSTPNNPTWVILSEGELEQLAKLCEKYDVIAIEDAAYLGMDSRKDYSKPNQPPFIPTILKYTEKSMLLMSASKMFSLAGHRIGLAAISKSLAERRYPSLEKRFGQSRFIDAYVMNGVYGTTSGASAVPQMVFAAMLEACTNGKFNFWEYTKDYSVRSKAIKEVLLKNGFQMVYKEDLGEPVSDGFMFSFSYPGMLGAELARKLIFYGISCTTLAIARSERKEAVRGCVSLISLKDVPEFQNRIEAFRKDHPR